MIELERNEIRMKSTDAYQSLNVSVMKAKTLIKIIIIPLLLLSFIDLTAQTKPLSMDVPKVNTNKKNKKQQKNNKKKEDDKDIVKNGPLDKVIKKHHIPPFVSGKVYDMTGLLASKGDSLVFEDFAYTQKVDLNKYQVEWLAQTLTDSTNYPNVDYTPLCVFAPDLSVELTDTEGNTKKFMIAYSCDLVGGFSKDAKGKKVLGASVFNVNELDLIKTFGHDIFQQTMGIEGKTKSFKHGSGKVVSEYPFRYGCELRSENFKKIKQ